MLKYQILEKSVQWELSCSTQMDGQTDMTKLGVPFLRFGECAYKRISHLYPFRSFKTPSGCVHQFTNSCVWEKMSVYCHIVELTYPLNPW